MGTQWLRATAIAALAAASVQAQAASVTLTGWAFGNGNNVNTTMYSGAAGGFRGSLTGAGAAGAADTASFITYCIELSESFHFGTSPIGNYNVVAGASYFQSRRSDAGIADRLGRLMTWVADNPTQVDNAGESTSLQLAIWNLVYDKDWSVTMTSPGSFDDSSIYRTQASRLLAGGQGVTSSRYDVFALERVGNQDFLLATQRPARSSITSSSASSQVPEPASLALVVAALAGLGLTGKLARKLSRKRGVSRAGAAAT